SGFFPVPLVASNLTVTGGVAGPQPWQLRIASEALQFESTIQISTNASGLDLQSTWLWASNRIQLNARFGLIGVLPEQASMEAQDFRVPGEVLRLPDYPQITGSAEAKWEQGKFLVNVAAVATPVSNQTNLPPVKIDIHGSGDTNSALIHSA